MIDYGYAQSELCWGDAYNMTETDIRKVLQGIKATGAKRVRMGVQVGTVAELDRAVNLSVEYGLKPLLCLIGNPVFGWAASVASYGAMCKTIAQRYGPQGTNQVFEFELFNEANSTLNPPGVADGAAFTQYLKAGYTAIKAVHTSSTVLAGGTIPAPDTWVPFIGSAVNPVTWYQQIYAAGGKNYFDAAGFHLYADTTPSPSMTQWKYMTDLHDVMVANGDGAKKIWVTEVGAGYPAPGVTSLVMARDWLKTMVEGIESYSWTGTFFVYNWRGYAGGDAAGGAYGMVDSDSNPRTPLFEYAQTIAGTPSNPGDIVPPNSPTGVGHSDVTSTTAKIVWEPNNPADGVTNYRIYTSGGVQLADTSSTFYTLTGLASGTPQSFYVTAVDAAGNESLPSALTPLTTDAPTGLTAAYQYIFSGSTVPTVFTQLGLGFTVSGGVALHNTATTNGSYYTVAPYNLDQQSLDHQSRISLAGVSSGSDRAAMTLVRVAEDGSQWVAALSTAGKADTLRILTYSGGSVRMRKARNAAPATAVDDLVLTVKGNTYTAQIIGPGAVVLAEVVWTDTNHVYPGINNRRTGIGWKHLRVHSINYNAPGITAWRSTDVGPIQPSAGVAEAWMLAFTDRSRWAQLISTGWEATI